jgi:type II secretory pathway pseudopilin PulG
MNGWTGLVAQFLCCATIIGLIATGRIPGIVQEIARARRHRAFDRGLRQVRRDLDKAAINTFCEVTKRGYCKTHDIRHGPRPWTDAQIRQRHRPPQYCSHDWQPIRTLDLPLYDSPSHVVGYICSKCFDTAMTGPHKYVTTERGQAVRISPYGNGDNDTSDITALTREQQEAAGYYSIPSYAGGAGGSSTAVLGWQTPGWHTPDVQRDPQAVDMEATYEAATKRAQRSYRYNTSGD